MPKTIRLIRAFFGVAVILVCSLAAVAQSQYDKQRIDSIEINFGGTQANLPLADQYRLLVKDALGPVYSAPRIRDAIDALYSTRRVDTITVAATLNSSGGVDLRFDVKRKTQAEKVTVVVGTTIGDKVLEQDLLFKLNLLTPGTAITDQTLRSNADEILDYLRERGFYQSEVTYERRPLQNENEVGVTFRVMPNAQAKVETFDIKIDGYSKTIKPGDLKLKVGGNYSRERLVADLAKIREILREDDFFAAARRASYRL
ncbi:MAG: hypothetical protein IPK98_10495 [Chloracidobacterium sp.]|nr:hypothetical protein [Chloracidobacterium sp.]